MKVILTLSLTLFLSLNPKAQTLNFLSQNSIGGSNDEDLEMYPSPLNDGYYFIGSSNSDISGNKTENSRGGDDIWIVKTDNNFNVIWDKTIGGSLNDNEIEVLLADDNFFITANSTSNISGEKTSNNFGSFDIWMICLDLNGTIVWQNQYGGTQYDACSSIIDYKPNSILIAATSNSYISGNKTVVPKGSYDIWLLEIDKTTGLILNQKDIGSSGKEFQPKLLKHYANNHIYIAFNFDWIAGSYIPGDLTDHDYIGGDARIVELDQNLNVIRDKSYGGSSREKNPQLIASNNAIFLFVESSSLISGNKTAAPQSLYGNWSSLPEGWLLKLDLNLDILWQKTYGGNSIEYVNGISQNGNGNLVLSLSSSSDSSGNKTSPTHGYKDAWLVITDPSGNILAQECYGGIDAESGIFIPFPNSTTELLLVASSNSDISGNKTVSSYGGSDCWIVKIDGSNFLNTEYLSGSNSTISVYPNPFIDFVNFDLGNLSEDVQLMIYSIDGKLVKEFDIQKGTNSIIWETSTDNEIFLYSILGKTVNHTGKIIKQ
ncbi:MAG: T9SS type A sorting domain-containing protein [Bacteroidota bacterium]